MEELTKEQIKDLEIVVDLAESSPYHDHTNDKACDRVRLLIKRFKVVDYSKLFVEKYNVEPSVGSSYPNPLFPKAVYDGSEWKTIINTVI